MPGSARQHQLQGCITYHTMSRAVSRQTIFHHDDDFDCFLDILRRYTDKCRIIIYHWVIMSNHYHLLLEIESPENLPSFMARINRSYTSYHHKTYQTCGYLWQGRYKAQPVQKNDHFLSCGRYIERNPVSANLVSQANDYKYSSAAYYLNGTKDHLTQESPFFTSLGNTIDERQRAYCEFLQAFDENEDKYFDTMENPIGDKIFLSKLIRSHGFLIPRRRGRNNYSTFTS